jgi:hypothetical protein
LPSLTERHIARAEYSTMTGCRSDRDVVLHGFVYTVFTLTGRVFGGAAPNPVRKLDIEFHRFVGHTVRSIRSIDGALFREKPWEPKASVQEKESLTHLTTTYVVSSIAPMVKLCVANELKECLELPDPSSAPVLSSSRIASI